MRLAPEAEAEWLAGLLEGDPPGGDRVHRHDGVQWLVKTLRGDPPDGATRWTMPALPTRLAEGGGAGAGVAGVEADLPGAGSRAVASANLG
jgi:hypothetical protein